MHRLFWAALSAALFYFFAVTPAPGEPFGVGLTDPPEWRTVLQKRFAGADHHVVSEIVEEIRAKKREDWLPLLNRRVNLSGVGDCAALATAKFEVLKGLGFAPVDLRIVVGRDVRDTVGPQRRYYHAMVAVRDHDEWLVLDNAVFVKHHFVVRPQDVRGFAPEFVLN